jgi:membrane protein DedA with SNARE-associated domain
MPILYVTTTLLIGELSWMINLGNSFSDFISGYGGPAVLLLAIGDSSFISVPEGNDLLIVILSTGKSWGNMIYFVSMTVVGSVIGCFLLYSVGRKGGRGILKKKFPAKKIERAENIYNKYGIMAVLIPSILPPPLPFKIFVLSAGVFGLSPYRFLSAVAIGRSIRYSMWGILAVLYGNSVKLFLQTNLNIIGTVTAVAVILIIIGTAVLYKRKKNRQKTNAG